MAMASMWNQLFMEKDVFKKAVLVISKVHLYQIQNDISEPIDLKGGIFGGGRFFISFLASCRRQQTFVVKYLNLFPSAHQFMNVIECQMTLKSSYHTVASKVLRVVYQGRTIIDIFKLGISLHGYFKFACSREHVKHLEVPFF